MCASLGAGAYTYRLVVLVLQFVAPVVLMMLTVECLDSSNHLISDVHRRRKLSVWLAYTAPG
jgi:hypothetical protein